MCSIGIAANEKHMVANWLVHVRVCVTKQTGHFAKDSRFLIEKVPLCRLIKWQ